MARNGYGGDRNHRPAYRRCNGNPGAGRQLLRIKLLCLLQLLLPVVSIAGEL